MHLKNPTQNGAPSLNSKILVKVYAMLRIKIFTKILEKEFVLLGFKIHQSFQIVKELSQTALDML